MSRMILLGIFALLVGAMLPLQAGLNGQLRTYVGSPALAAWVSFAVGTILLSGYVVAVRAGIPSIADVAQAPWWVWFGGLLGALYLVATIVVAPRLGATLFFGLVVAGQMTNSLLLDHFGLVGYPAHPLTLVRVLGVVLLAAGVIVIRAT